MVEWNCGKVGEWGFWWEDYWCEGLLSDME